jgi:GAF domain-containing protein
MNARSDGAAPTGRAVDALVELNEQGGSLCLPDTDPFVWADDVLHDLARVAGLLGHAAQRVTGQKNAVIERHAHALAATLAARGNIQLLRRHP